MGAVSPKARMKRTLPVPRHKRGEPRGEAPLVVMMVVEMTYSVVHSGLVKNQLEVSKSLL